MYIRVNNETQEITENTSIQNLVDQLKISINGIAIAINNTVIKKSEWNTTVINNNDDILIIKSTQGG